MAAGLALELVALETGVSSCLDGLAERAAAALAAAEAGALPALAGRARIVLADLAMRTGDLRGSLARAQAVLAATPDTEEHQLVRAGAHTLLSWGFSLLGLGDEALVHCLRASRSLPPDAPEHLRISAGMMFALVQGIHLPGDGYRSASTAAVAEAERLGRTEVLLDVHNNAVWLDWRHGHLAEAVAGVARIEAVAAERGARLTSTVQDTIANVLLSTGDLEGAERHLAAAVAPSAVHVEIGGPTDAMLTTVRLRRSRGDLAGGLRWARRARELADRRGLPEAHAHALQQEAELLAETGDFPTAYRAQVEFHGRWERLRSELTDARTALLAGEYETERARRESERNAELAEKDPLTGLWNRRHLARRAPGLLARARAAGEPISLAIVDLDAFKIVNDDFSHDVGDSVLQAVADIMLAAVPADGCAVRLGGDEFLLLLPGHGERAAGLLSEGIVGRLRDTDWAAVTGVQGAPPLVAATVGIATVIGDGAAAAAGPGIVVADLLRAADTSLYRGKRAGRDRVGEPVVVPPGTSVSS